ncbi:MAG TPA: cadmium-translocating P-type ATPase [Clostridia bacterium]|nr:cadmium-translocating P-type ATPase [Clostridia bacterium]
MFSISSVRPRPTSRKEGRSAVNPTQGNSMEQKTERRANTELREDTEDTGREDAEDTENIHFSIVISGVLLALGLLFNSQLHDTPYSWAEYAVLLPAYLLVGWKVLCTAAKNVAAGRVFGESFLMSVATLGAVAIHQLPEAVSVMLFYEVGEYLQERAVNRSRRSIAALLDIRPQYANLAVGGEIRRVRPEEVQTGQTIIVRPGEKVPLDGEVVSGVSFMDTSALTGESVPRKAEAGGTVLAGMINGEGVLTIKATKPFAESSVARILDLVEGAAAHKARTEQFITRFSQYYTPVVVTAALGLAIIPSLVVERVVFAKWVYRALVLLVISCPCALVVSIPLGYFGGIGAASRHGILVKGANFLDALGKLHTVVFDKTGTLTKGVFRVTAIVSYNGFKKEELLATAAAAEVHSNHPIARSIREAYRETYGKEPFQDITSDYREMPGRGISATVDGKRVLVGNDRLMHEEGIEHEVCRIEGSGVHVAINGVFAGYIVISDELRTDAVSAVNRLKRLGVKRVVMLTGDEEEAARRVARTLALDAYFAELLPEEKVTKVQELKATVPDNGGGTLAFLGDGINDAPAISIADVGVAMAGPGSDAAIEAADVVFMEEAPSKLAVAIQVARYTEGIVKQNVALALGVKAFFAFLGAFGLAGMWEAVFADVGVALAAVFNATRTLRFGGNESRRRQATVATTSEYRANEAVHRFE